MNVIAYLFSTEERENKRLLEFQNQKFEFIDFCKNNNYKLIECKAEQSNNPENLPVLFKILTENTSKFDVLLFYSKEIFTQDEEFKNWLFNELKQKKIKFDFIHKAEEEISEKDIEAKKRLLINKVQSIPSLPTIVTKILKLIKNEKSSAWQLAKIIKYDLGLTGKILRLVNSSFYGFPKQISSIQHGITILGFNTIKGLVISSSVYKNFKPEESNDLFNYNKFWLHTTLCATLANEFLKEKTEFSETEKDEVFSCANLHDIGKLILNQYDQQNYKQVLLNEKSPLNVEENLKLERDNCTLAHTTIGQLVIEAWNLPAIISQTAKFHHTPLMAEDENQSLISVINITNILSHLILEQISPTSEMFDENILKKSYLTYDTILNKYNEFQENPQKLDELKRYFV